MTLGQKIKSARLDRRMSQSSLCQEKITRNMLSAIENDKATPSLDTIKFIAMRLELPLSYLVSEDDDIFFYKKASRIASIRNFYKEKKYKKCIDLILSIKGLDDELAYILSTSYFYLGKKALFDGSLSDAAENFSLFKKYAPHTVYSTQCEDTLCDFYSAVAKNIKSPLLELDQNKFEQRVTDLADLDFYKFVVQDKNHTFKNQGFSKHLQAKAYIKDHRYQEALTLLKEVEDERYTLGFNAYQVISIYSDMSACFKQLGDFENAYKYSNKQLMLIEQLND